MSLATFTYWELWLWIKANRDQPNHFGYWLTNPLELEWFCSRNFVVKYEKLSLMLPWNITQLQHLQWRPSYFRLQGWLKRAKVIFPNISFCQVAQWLVSRMRTCKLLYAWLVLHESAIDRDVSNISPFFEMFIFYNGWFHLNPTSERWTPDPNSLCCCVFLKRFLPCSVLEWNFMWGSKILKMIISKIGSLLHIFVVR